MSNNYNQTSDFVPFRSGCGMCKASTDYYNQPHVGGGNYSEDGLIPESNGENLFKYPQDQLSLDNKFIKDNYGVDYATSFGGSKKPKPKSKDSKKTKVVKKLKKPVKKMRGGEESSGATPLPMRYFNSDIQTNTVSGNDIGTNMLATYVSDGGAKSGKKVSKSSKKVSSTKSGKKVSKSGKKKTMKGGMESSGATPMNQRFYDVNASLDNYPEFSGNGIVSAYGPIESGDVGTGMLAPYTASTCSSANPNTTMKTGGAKSKKPSKKDTSKKPSKKEKSKKPPKKGKKTMKGGMESSGATPMSQRFYDVNASLDNYSELSGNGIVSAYGPIESGDVGTGMLAPYTASTCSSADPNTAMKTGGAKSKAKKDSKPKSKKDSKSKAKKDSKSKAKKDSKPKHKSKGGDGPIPYISDDTVNAIQGTVTGAINGFSSFMQQLDADYLKSVQYAESIKIGNQRLIQGGKKTASTKKTADKKKTASTKKTADKKKHGKKKVGGSTGSDWATSQGSRGPSNAPDDYWGVPGEEWFRQFNKTGDYIPNSQLPYAATPELAGEGHSAVVSGYDAMGMNYGST